MLVVNRLLARKVEPGSRMDSIIAESMNALVNRLLARKVEPGSRMDSTTPGSMNARS
jgi:hypothetical protein